MDQTQSQPSAPLNEQGHPPSLPPRHNPDHPETSLPLYNPQDHVNEPYGSHVPITDDKPALPTATERKSHEAYNDITSPIHYTRDPQRLIAYLIPLPKPTLPASSQHQADKIPSRFLIYTPPPPPLSAPPTTDSNDPNSQTQKESKIHKVQRKWESEIRQAKTSNAKLASWQGVKGRATKGINWAMQQTKSSNLEFINRLGGNASANADPSDESSSPSSHPKLNALTLIYPSSPSALSPEDMRTEFINSMLRSKSKAERDSIIATGLLPVTAAIDILAMIIWPFGGLLEIDAVWAYASIRGAKTSRSVTKRLKSSSGGNDDELKLEFVESERLGVLQRYLDGACHDRDEKLFPGYATVPTEGEVLEAIGWTPSHKGGEERNWEDEQWEISEVKDDLRSVMQKGAKEWDKWCKSFEKNPEKALKRG